jgi:NAD(P)-dependent dehydrogenase (short-subunit alcohol dehydrogenase family)
MDELKDKVAVVTGAASGIGFALAERFAAENMKLVLADVEDAALKVAADRLRERGAEVLTVPTDVSVAASVEDCARNALERFGSVHVVCNNAGVGGQGFSTWETPIPSWEWVFGVNLWGVVHGIRAFVPHLLEQNEGHVVNTASVAGLMATPFLGPYCATKHAVVAISEALHLELAIRGSAVGVTVVCPGFVSTQIADSDRNWPARLGPKPEPETEPLAQLIEKAVRTRIAEGVAPGSLADQVVDAIQTRRFLVTSDLQAARYAVNARVAAVDGSAPQLPPLL